MRFDLKTLSPTEILDIMDRVARLHDDATVDSALAALYLNSTPRTLENMRGDGTGPAHVKAPAARGSTGRNQTVNYKMRALREWQRANTVNSTIESAVRQGLAFGSLRDIIEEQPFIARDGMPLGHAMVMSAEALRSALEDDRNDVVWLPMDEALSMGWADQAARVPFHYAYVSLLLDAVSAAEAGRDAGDIAATIAFPEANPIPPDPFL